MHSILRSIRCFLAPALLGIITYNGFGDEKASPKASPKAPPDAAGRAGDAAPMLVTDPGGHTSKVKACFFSPDGETAFTLSNDKTVRAWEVSTGELLQTFRLPIGIGNEGVLYTGAISPDGNTLAVAGIPVGRGELGHPIYLLNRHDGRVTGVLKGHKFLVQSLAFLSDGKRLISGGSDKTAILFDIATGAALRTFEGHADELRSLAVSKDDKWLATICFDNTFRIWDIATGKSVAEVECPIITASFSPTEELLAVGCVDGTIRTYKLDGSLVSTFRVDPKIRVQVVSIQVSPDGKEALYTGVCIAGHAGILDLATGKHRIVFPHHTNTVFCGRYSMNGSLAVTTGGDDHETFVWRTADASVVNKLQGGGKSVWAVGWRLDGRAIAWGNTNKGSTVLAASRLEKSFLLDDLEFGVATKFPDAGDNPHPNAVEDRAQLFGRIALRMGPWELRPGDFTTFDIIKNDKRYGTFRCSEFDRIYSMTMMPGDRAVVGTGARLYLADLATGKIVRTFSGHTGIVLGVSPAPDGKTFLSGSNDQTISLWDPDQDEPLVSLFFADRDWIAWTPQGYYASSAQGERLMGWQVNNGPDKESAFHPAARFRASLYNPELIRALFKEKNLEKAFEVVRKKDKTPGLETISVAKVLPPVVEITSPRLAATTIGQAEILVTARAKSSGNQPVTALRLLVDGRPYRGKESLKPVANAKPGEVEVSWTVDLLPGKHQLAVLAESAVSKGMSPIIDVTRTGAKAEDLPTLYVLAVGISDYPGELKLNYAHLDAASLEKALRDGTQNTFKTVESVLLTNGRATRKEVLAGLDWLAKKMTARDVAVVFFSGHGDRDDKGHFHLLPVDVDLDRVGATCIPGDLLKDRIANLPGRVVAMLDACHSGAATTTIAKKSIADELVRELVSEDLGVVVMCSSQGSEFSLESPDTKHGYFTLGVVEALGGKADYNKDKYIYLHEIDMYAFARVRSLSRGVQNPTTGRSPQIRSFPLASVGGGKQ